MRLAAELALRGKGRVKTNPCVGAVVVKNGVVLSSGWHEKFGEAHAEINALLPLAETASGADLYVTLEPCSTYGKTPPCTKAIIEKGIKKVFIGAMDPTPANGGKGVEELKKAGIDVVTGVEAELCAGIIEDFRKYTAEKLPYVTVKIAQSLDGKIAAASGVSRWITSEASRAEVHKIRDGADAVLVGINTAIADNPYLTVRSLDTEYPREFPPLRVVLDRKARLAPTSHLADVTQARTLIYTGDEADKGKVQILADKGVETATVKTDGDFLDLREILGDLASRGAMNLLVEGGGTVFTSFLEAKLADKLHIFIAPKILGGERSSVKGFPALKLEDAPHLRSMSIRECGGDIWIEGKI
jgi:diaminohydroxyphosphoribosylaminopyrimidine deaminase/5-amino-6-(5-phosphoribosylamino)uracil reductase